MRKVIKFHLARWEDDGSNHHLHISAKLGDKHFLIYEEYQEACEKEGLPYVTEVMWSVYAQPEIK